MTVFAFIIMLKFFFYEVYQGMNFQKLALQNW